MPTTLRRTRLVKGTVYPGRYNASLTIIELPAETYGGRLKGRIELERTIPAGGGWYPPHWHTDFSEIYVIKSGIADAFKRGERRRLKAGETFRVSPYVDHVGPFNRDSAPLTMRHIIDPATELALAYCNTLANALLDGRDRKG